MANIEMPDVTVEQIFTTSNPTLTPPDLPTVLVGVCRQIAYRQSAGEYSGSTIVVGYPDLKPAAVVDVSGVKVYLSNNYGVFQIDSNNFSASSDSITVDGGISLDVRVIENSQTGTSEGVFFSDDNTNFNAKFAGVTTKSIVISSPSDNQKVFDVVSVLNNTTILVKDHEDGIVKVPTAFGTAPTTNVVTGTNIVIKELVTSDTITFTNTISAGTSQLIESTFGSVVGSVRGDYIALFDGAGAFIEMKKISNVSEVSSGKIIIDSVTSTAVTASSTQYKIFHPVFVKNSILGYSGDYVIATTNSINYYGEVSSLVGLNTITLVSQLKDINDNTTLWGNSDTYSIYRGALKNTDANVYDGYINLTSYTADILVNYTAVRNDLNDDIEPITGPDDVTSLLGAETPDNPLGFAASIHTGLSTNLFYVIGTSADTKNAHQHALEALESKEVYSLVPLSQDLDVLSLYKPHVQAMSEPKEKMERHAIICRDIHVADDVNVGGNPDMIGGTDGSGNFILGMVNYGGTPNAATITAVTSISMAGIGYGASVGDLIGFGIGNPSTANFATITYVSPSLGGVSFSPTVSTISPASSFQIISETYTFTHSTISDGSADLSVVASGNVINLLDVNGIVDVTSTVETITAVDTGVGNTYQYATMSDGSLGTGLRSKIFSATTQPLNKQEQAEYIRDFAASILERRVISVWAPRVKLSYTPVEDPTTELTAVLPGYYLATGIAAMTSSNAPSQPFTNLPMSISCQLYYTNTYFKPSYLDSIATGGNYILVQTTPDSFPYSRQQLTTDMTSIQTREYSIMKALDWFAKFMRTSLRPYVGRFNITGNYIAQLKGVGNAAIRETVSNRGYLASANLVKLFQSTTQPDEVFVDVDVGVLYPANKIRVRIYI